VDGVTRTVTEPEWDDDERDYMLALAAWEASLCPVCGGPAEECQAPDADRRFKGVPPVRCHRTDAVRRFQEKSSTYPRPEALIWHAEVQG